jgi:hypothetical protein
MTQPEIKPPTKKTFHFPKSKAATGEAKKKRGKSRTPAQAPAAVAAATAATAAVAAPETTANAAAQTTKRGKQAKPAKKDKLVRDSFKLPGSEYARIGVLKKKCLANGLRVRKSDLLRAGLQMLENSTQEHLVAAIGSLVAGKAVKANNADKAAKTRRAKA